MTLIFYVPPIYESEISRRPKPSELAVSYNVLARQRAENQDRLTTGGVRCTDTSSDDGSGPPATTCTT